MTADQLQQLKQMTAQDFEAKYLRMFLKGQISKKQYDYLKQLRNATIT